MSTGALALVVALFAGCQCCKQEKSKTIELFDGKSLAGWKAISEDPKVPMRDVWQVKDGVIHCTGTPIGAIYKGPDVTNFRLVVEYRWAGEPGNSGIFSRIGAPYKPIPGCVEVQLKPGSAGDTMGLQGRKIEAGQARFFSAKAHPVAGDIAGVRKLSEQEKTAGEWNRVEILADGPRYQVWMNGQLVNDANGVEMFAGPIGLQSEGGAIQFRKVTLTPMP